MRVAPDRLKPGLQTHAAEDFLLLIEGPGWAGGRCPFRTQSRPHVPEIPNEGGRQLGPRFSHGQSAAAPALFPSLENKSRRGLVRCPCGRAADFLVGSRRGWHAARREPDRT